MLRKLLLIGLSALALAGCKDGVFDAIAEEPVQEDPFARPAKITTASKVAFSFYKTFPGVTAASRNSILAFRVAGQISELPIHAGQILKEGDVIAKLDDTPYKNVVAQRQATFDLAQIQLTRTESLFEKKHVAKAALDTAKATFSGAEVALKMAKEDVGYTVLHAPYDGVIAKVNVERYQNVAAGAAVIQFQGRDDIDIVFNVPEKLLLLFNPISNSLGLAFEVRFDALPDQKFLATYKEHDALPDAVTRSFKVTATMPVPKELSVLPGMSVNVRADVAGLTAPEGTGGVLVPLESVFEEAGKRWVWKVDPQNQARKTEVEVFGLEDGSVRILEGLQDGDRLVAVGVSHVAEGMKLRAYQKERGL
ncbi:efflux RND transporter periplasmic adaptor subunit [Cohaesibacter sp. CAU 1516]|uniref:efflux RND transporter periplasmic adaptor subunit n=1 Tax=Cohaesibacter sp. CAU 1516 TaxID=2576038 RepID=UPI001484F634|nr:efflux RND transporter periplasmic adaptor subunit [Cohaesibacter sp. CAU 1516]